MNVKDLLSAHDLPRYNELKPEACAPTIDALIAQAQAALAEVTRPETPATWDTVMVPLTSATEQLSRLWSAVHHMGAVMDSPEWREATNSRLEAVTQFWLGVAQNLALFEKFKALAHDPSVTQHPARARALENSLRDFRMGGAELAPEAQAEFSKLATQSAQAGQKFSEQLLDSTNASTHWIDPSETSRLAGLPDHAVAAAAEAAEAAGKPGYLFTLKQPSLIPVLQFAEDRSLRETMYKLNARRASEIAEEGPQHDNTPVMGEILVLRQAQAKLLGFGSAAEMLLESKMADSPEAVVKFLRELAAKARPSALSDLADLRSFAATELGLSDLQPWDISFASEKLRQARYDYSENTLREYFPLPRVLNGLFGCIRALFGVSLVPATQAPQSQPPIWHPDVQVFDVVRQPQGSREAEVVGHVFLDLYARATKRGGAWMDDARGRRHEAAVGLDQKPIALLTCNFAPPTGEAPTTLTHDDVITLFHEFGHGLHHLLTRVNEIEVSGINGVEWDAVELPSQFMENFAWEWETLQAMTAHTSTQAPLPQDLYDKIIAAKNFQSGLATLRQIEFALFDLRIHHELRDIHDAAEAGAAIQRVLQEVRDEVAVLMPPAINRFAQSFSHIFAGGYAAGYYSYKWAEVLSADAYAAFEEAGDAGRAAVGERFLAEILSQGGSRPAMESFKAFRGREPSIEPLLRHTGLAA